ncbi:Rieske 2Fe-2S domain-containing protein [Allobranchiibius sp. GilTou38]|uniref:cytochrome bc1 complex Rieske iron-sulfur subunit n=1 Tax=Allobranchiibius sp. GilTou38 TaxID=2815210 RepID=UPI001AA1B066|nr:Rieske 2Fe-2S domain-containing protein [Allobranchiibius sp. GilTou38]MBO1766890.1 Rieske (2Fe-2S) protein [Allobranchiibius sp. GilTou38]
MTTSFTGPERHDHSEHQPEPGEVARGGHGSDLINLGDGHHEGGGQLLERFDNPGLPEHVHRLGDDDPAAARRSERQVASLFAVSMVATLLFVISYIVVGKGAIVTLPLIGPTKALHVSLGVTLGISLLCIGLGAVHWAKTLMSDTEVVEERHTLRSPDEDREGTVQILTDAAESTQITRRPLIKYSLGGALGLFVVPLGLQLVGSLGPLPHDNLGVTLWDRKLNGKGRRLMRDPENTPIRLSDVTLGSVFHVLPEGIDDVQNPQDAKVKAAVLLVSMQESDIKNAKEASWGIQGVVAYSKICTHVGCPVGLYEHTTHHLLCPCHQSTFDMTNDCEVIFGPAKRRLPQLKISVNDAGYLVADQGFQEPVGPSFWERA